MMIRPVGAIVSWLLVAGCTFSDASAPAAPSTGEETTERAPAGRVAWRTTLATDGRGQLGGLAGDVHGNAFVAWHAVGSENLVRLERISDGGVTPLGVFGVEGGLAPVFRDSPNLLWKPDGSLFLGVTAFVGLSQAVHVDLGGGRRTGAQTVELREDGRYVRTVLTCCSAYFESTSWVEDVDAEGNLLVGHFSTGSDWTKLVRADGTEVLLWHDPQRSAEPAVPSLLPGGCFSPRFAPDRSVVCGGRGPSLAKVSLDGRTRWTIELGHDGGTIEHVGVAADGTVVAAGYGVAGGEVETAYGEPATPAGAGFLLAVGPDAEPRWVREVTPAPRALAVQPEGDVAVLLAESALPRGRVDLLRVAADGSVRWRSAVDPARRIAFAGRELLVAGTTERGAVVVHSFGP